jgi:predicted hydrocarbon binding protein
MDRPLSLLSRAAVRVALVAGSLAEGRLFWARAALGENQLRMHDCDADGAIGIGGVSEQLYGEGFVLAWHEVLARELGDRAPEVLYEVGVRGARWEVEEAIRRRVWVPLLLRPFVGKPAMLEKARASRVHHALVQESLRILFRMIMTEGGWGVVEELDLRARPLRLVVRNTPEPRRVGRTGQASCHLMRGIYAGYFATLFGGPFSATESTCVSRGDARCTFELTPVEARIPAPDREAVATA